MDAVKILAIFKKQGKDILKNKTVFVQFVIFPVIAAIMQGTVELPGLEKNYFVYLFATMYVGMAPLTAMATFLSEEREKCTYRMLRMSNVKPVEFLAGVGACIFIACMAGALAFGLIGGFSGILLMRFLGIMALGMAVSMTLGAAIGLGSRNQMMATSVSVPVMMVFAFLPMIGMFNETIKRVAAFTFSQGVNDMLMGLSSGEADVRRLGVIGLNFLAAALLFAAACRKRLPQ